MIVSVRTARSESGGGGFDRAAEGSVAVVGVGVVGRGRGYVGAERARSWRSWRRVEGRRGWEFARGDGGAVIWKIVLKARRNWRAERLLGKTWFCQYGTYDSGVF